MTPAAAIAALDKQLAAHGEDILVRKTNTAVGQLSTRAKCRLYKPGEIAGILMVNDQQVILSPTGLGSFGVPPMNGYAVVGGVPLRIVAKPREVKIDNVLVRVEMVVRG